MALLLLGPRRQGISAWLHGADPCWLLGLRASARDVAAEAVSAEHPVGAVFQLGDSARTWGAAFADTYSQDGSTIVLFDF